MRCSRLRLAIALVGGLMSVPLAIAPAQGASFGLEVIRETIAHFPRVDWECLEFCPNLPGQDPAEAGGGSSVTRLSGNEYSVQMVGSTYAGLNTSLLPINWSASAVAQDTYVPLIDLEVTGNPGAQARVTFEYELDLIYSLLLFAVPPTYSEVESVYFLKAIVTPQVGLPWEEGLFREEFSRKALGASLDISEDYLVPGVKELSAPVTVGDRIRLFGNFDLYSRSVVNPTGFSVATNTGAARFTMTVIPEPSTALLMGLGLVGLGMQRRN